MREIAIGGGCVVVLLVGLALFAGAFDTSSTREPSHAMELAQVRAEASAARQEAEKAKGETERLAAELEKARTENERLKARVAELEKKAPAPK
jgi:septal ring factor EnvC (AmiA/AmiB activator)